jgi:IS5 family transposase
MMKLKPAGLKSDELFVSRLDELINMRHPLVRLASLLTELRSSAPSAHFSSGRGRPALPPRLVVGLLYLQHTFDASDEAVVNTWIENPYWQYCCGDAYLQAEAPIDPSSLTRWRKRIGEEGVETLLMATIEAARRGGLVKASNMDRVIIDMTVVPKAIAHPTDSRLLEKSRQQLVNAEEHSIPLRQNYNRMAPRLAAQIGGYAPCQTSSSACAVPFARCARAWVECSVKWRANSARCQSRHRPRSATCSFAPVASWPSARKTRTSSMHCMPRKSNAPRRARPERPTNSA